MKYDCNYSKFDFEQHVKHYFYYCEVIILEDGDVHYAHPSHVEFLCKEYCRRHNCTRQELETLCWKQFELPLDFLLKELNAVAVYYDFYVGKPNEKQQATLNKLQETGCCDFN